MPRNQVSLDELKVFVEKIKQEILLDSQYFTDSKDCANKYLNKILDKINEYRY
jgi:hypothetical protein